MKLPNKYGTIKKLSGSRRRPYIVLTPEHIAQTKTGVKRDILGYFETKEEALAVLAKYNESPNAYSFSAKKYTLKKLYSEFIKTRRFTKISKSTQDNYKAAWKRLYMLYDESVEDLRTRDFQYAIDEAEEEGMSYSSIQKIRIFAHLLMDYAMQLDIVSKNYVDYVILPTKKKKEKQPFTDEQLLIIEKGAEDGVLYADLILLLCFTGWRISEFLQLKVSDYDRELKTLTGGLKTDAGRNRVVPVSDKVLPYLEKWISKGGEYIVCREESGKLIQVSANYFRSNWYYPTLEALHLPRLTPHATRHTFASVLHKRGVENTEIQRLMGHASYEITDKVYTHVDIETLKKAVDKI